MKDGPDKPARGVGPEAEMPGALCGVGRAIIETAWEPLVIVDLELRVRGANRAFLRKFDVAQRDLEGRFLYDLPRARWELPRLRDLLEQALSGAGVVRDFEIAVESSGTGPRSLILAAQRLPGFGAEAGLAVLAVEDPTPGEERFRLLVEGVKDFAVFMLGSDGRVTSWNAGAERILGYRSDEAVGHPLAHFHLPEGVRDGEPEEALRVARLGGTFETEGWRVRKEGTRFLAHVLVTALGDEERRLRGYSVVMRDVTERRHLEDQLRQSQKMEAVGRLAGGVAHDFNNILTAILGYSNLLLGRLSEGDPDRADVTEIRRAGERAADLTRQLLAFSRRQALQLRRVDLNSIVEGACAILRRVIGEDIEIVRNLAPDLGPVQADPGQVEQILMNLAVNSRDAMPRGGTLAVETGNVDLSGEFARTHLGAVPGRYAMLAVSDTGCGMSEEIKAHLFEPFFTTKAPGKGTGLGLSTVYGIVKQSNGTIWVESEPGSGTTFRIYLPRDDGAAELQAIPAEPSAAPGRELVLVVEDDEPVRILAGRILEERGYRVLSAGHPGKALRLLEAQVEPVDLLLTDIVMPEMSGFDLAERALALRPRLKILYMSGYTSASIIDRLSMRSALLLKPFTPDALLRKVRQAVGGVEPRQERSEP